MVRKVSGAQPDGSRVRHHVIFLQILLVFIVSVSNSAPSIDTLYWISFHIPGITGNVAMRAGHITLLEQSVFSSWFVH